jgi:hypothetical protein
MSLHAYLRFYSSCQNRSAPVTLATSWRGFHFRNRPLYHVRAITMDAPLQLWPSDSLNGWWPKKASTRFKKSGFLCEISYKYTAKKIHPLIACELSTQVRLFQQKVKTTKANRRHYCCDGCQLIIAICN